NLVARAKALTNLCILAERQGRVDAAVDYGIEALAINERLGSRREMALSATNIGFALLDREDYRAARDYFRQALDHATAAHDQYHQMLALLDLGRALLGLGEGAAAEQATGRSLALAGQLQLPLVQLEARVLLGELALQRGDLDTA